MKMIIYATVDRFGNEHVCNIITNSLLEFINNKNEAYAKLWSGKRAAGAHEATLSVKILNVIDITEQEANAFTDMSYSNKYGMEYEDNAFNTTVVDLTKQGENLMSQDNTKLSTVSERLKQFYNNGTTNDEKLAELKELVKVRSELDSQNMIARYLESTQEFLQSKKAFDFTAFEEMDYKLGLMIDLLIRHRLELWAHAFNPGILSSRDHLPELENLLAINQKRIGLLPGYEYVVKYVRDYMLNKIEQRKKGKANNG